MTESLHRSASDRSAPVLLRIGDWCVDPVSGDISRNGETARLEVRAMRLLLCLADRAGEIVSIDTLLDQVWTGVNVAPDSVYQAVTSLRRQLGDDPRQPAYIATVPRLGYRMVATVGPWVDAPIGDHGALSAPASESIGPSPTAVPAPPRRTRTYLWFAVFAILCLALAAIYLVNGRLAKTKAALPAVPAVPQNSVAVLPFLDLTEGMKNEEFADGITEELIDKLSKIPGLHVPSATASFYFKNKQVPLGDMARKLGAAYILDGSVRKAGARVRVAARLVRPENGYVLWSETYDRPTSDLLWVQDDIAGEVTKALSRSIVSAPGPGQQ